MDKKVNFQEISEFEAPEQSPGFLLWQVSASWRRKIEQSLKEFDLTHPQFVVLASLAWFAEIKKQVSQKELSTPVLIDTATVSQIIRGLEKKGLITRARIEGDERAKYPTPTDAGALLITKALPSIEACDKKFFAHLDNQQDFLKHLNLLAKYD